MSSNTQNPILKQNPVNIPNVLKPTTKPVKKNDPTKDTNKSISKLSSDIEKKNKLILERLKLENSQIEDYIQILNNQRKTDRTSMDYDSYYYNLLDNIYTPLFVLYLLGVVGVGYFLFMMENDYSMSMKVLLMSVFILYPFVIEYIEDTVISWMNYFYNLLRFTPHGTNPIKTATESQPFLFSQRFNIRDKTLY